MPKGIDNLRDRTVTTGSGRDVTDTMQLSGEAQRTPAEKETNATKQYETSGKVSGPLGGEPSGL